MNFVFPSGHTLKSVRPMSDIYNSDGTRNMNTVVTESCNCGGYALETYNWFLPIFIESVVSDDAEEKWLIENEYEDTDNLDWKEESDMYATIQDAVNETFANLKEEAEYIFGDNYNEQVEKEVELVYFSSLYNTETALALASAHMLEVFDDLRAVESFDELEEDEYGIIYRGGGWDFHFVKYDQLTDTYTHKMGFHEVEEVEDEDEAFGEEYDSRSLYFAKKRNDFEFQWETTIPT